MKTKLNSGFTLIELMVTVALVSILMSIGLPSFKSIIDDSKLTSTANAMLSAYQLARSYAIKTGKRSYVTTTDNWETWETKYTDPFTNVINTAEKFTASTNVIITKYLDVDGYEGNGRQVKSDGTAEACGVTDIDTPVCGFTFTVTNVVNSRSLNVMTTGRIKVFTPDPEHPKPATP